MSTVTIRFTGLCTFVKGKEAGDVTVVFPNQHFRGGGAEHPEHVPMLFIPASAYLPNDPAAGLPVYLEGFKLRFLVDGKPLNGPVRLSPTTPNRPPTPRNPNDPKQWEPLDWLPDLNVFHSESKVAADLIAPKSERTLGHMRFRTGRLFVGQPSEKGFRTAAWKLNPPPKEGFERALSDVAIYSTRVSPTKTLKLELRPLDDDSLQPVILINLRIDRAIDMTISQNAPPRHGDHDHKNKKTDERDLRLDHFKIIYAAIFADNPEFPRIPEAKVKTGSDGYCPPPSVSE